MLVIASPNPIYSAQVFWYLEYLVWNIYVIIICLEKNQY